MARGSAPSAPVALIAPARAQVEVRKSEQEDPSAAACKQLAECRQHIVRTDVDPALERLTGMTVHDKLVVDALDRAEAKLHIDQLASHSHDGDLAVAVLVRRTMAMVFRSGRRQKRRIGYSLERRRRLHSTSHHGRPRANDQTVRW